MTKNAHAGEDRYSEDELRAFGLSVLDRLDVPPERASAMVDHLLTADLMGHRTHGLALLNWYVGQILTEEIQPSGELETLHETPTSVAYSAPGVPGAWAVHRALDALETRMPPATVTTTTIAGCSHVGALQPFLERVTAQNRIVLMAATNPGVASVAPPGGTKAVTTSNPIAVGIPTGTAPILIDQCTSMISNSLCEEYR